MFKYLLLLSFLIFTIRAYALYQLPIKERQAPQEVNQAVQSVLSKCGMKGQKVQRILYSEQEIAPFAFFHFYTYEFSQFAIEISTQFHFHHDNELILSTHIVGLNCKQN